VICDDVEIVVIDVVVVYCLFWAVYYCYVFNSDFYGCLNCYLCLLFSHTLLRIFW